LGESGIKPKIATSGEKEITSEKYKDYVDSFKFYSMKLGVKDLFIPIQIINDEFTS